jgi:tetratricopeptide (TPR) repeat protein
MCYEEQEKWAEAADLYETGLQRLEAESHASLAQQWSGVFKTRLLAAYRNTNDTENMIRIFQGSLASDPAAPSAPEDQFELGMVYLEIDEPGKAADNFAMLVDRYPFSEAARRVQNEHAELMTAELDYDWAPFNTFQASVRLSQTGHYEEARQGFDQVIVSKQNTAMEHAVRFQKELLEFRKSGDAASLRERLSNPDEYPYGFGGVNATGFLGLLDRIVAARENISTNPEDVGAYSGMAFTYYQLQAFYPGIEAYKQAISITPDNTLLHNMLGYCCIGVEAFDEAIEAFQQLIEISPEDPNSYDSMAEAYYVMGDTAMAIQYYQQSLSIDSSFTNPYYMLGEIHHGNGQYDEARNYLARYLDLDPEGFRAEAAQGLLSEITEEQQ